MRIKAKMFKYAVSCLLAVFMMTAAVPAAQAAPDPSVLKDARQFEVFADNFMREAMTKYNVPGVTLSVVKDGKVLYKRGYGYADIEKKTLVDPDRTIFNLGSVTKLFTATAAMQLVEQGKIDLNTDINTYIKNFKIKTSFKRPVTMAHLLTHTGGFDESNVGMAQDYSEESEILGDYLKSHMPPVIREPGTIIQYSNHGMGLAGYIVEQVSGTSYERYIEQKILTPLGMRNSTYIVTKDIEPNVASCYTYIDNMYVRLKPFNINIPPAGSLVSTADDMSKFIIAHLQKGKTGDKRILNEGTALEMYKQQFTNYKGMPGFGYGFYESHRNRIRVLEHAGILSSYMSMISILPEENAGFFISTNSEGGNSLINDFSEEFYKLFKTSKQVAPVLAGIKEFKPSAKDYEGTYSTIRRSKENIMKIASSVSSSQDIKVKAGENNQLILSSGTEEKSFTQVDEGLFQNTKDNSYLAFKKDTAGNIYMVPGSSSIKAYERLKWYEKGTAFIIMLSLCLIVFLSGCVLGLFFVIGKRRLKKKGHPGTAMGLLFTECIINIAFIIGFFIYFINNYTLAATTYLNVILCLPIISTVITAAMILLGVKAWRRGYWKTGGRAYYTLVTSAAVVFVIILNYFKLIGFRY